jgi:hypothetical protein
MPESLHQRVVMRPDLSGGHIRAQIDTLLVERAGERRSDGFIHFCHRLAVAYLKGKTASGRFDARRYGIAVEDFAFDAIAELFRRDEAGNFVEWLTYFSRQRPVSALTDDELFVAVRRIVLSSVNNRIFRVFGEFEPVQAKIARNVKLALKRHPLLLLKEVSGEHLVLLRRAVHNEGRLPEVAPETIDAWFTGRVSAASTLRDILDCVSSLLEERPFYRSAVHLFPLVRSIGMVYGRGYVNETASIEEPAFAPHEMRKIVDAVVMKARAHGSSAYVERGKLTASEFQAHVLALQAILFREYGLDGVEQESYFALLKRQLPALTREKYTKRHRVVLEYLAKLAKSEVETMVRRDLNSAEESGCHK